MDKPTIKLSVLRDRDRVVLSFSSEGKKPYERLEVAARLSEADVAWLREQLQ